MNWLRRTTDQSLTALGDQIAPLGSAEASRKHITQAKTDMSGARRAIDMSVLAPGMATEVVCTFDRKGVRTGLRTFSMFVYPGEGSALATAG